jgi:rare lipoprotein A
MMLKANRVFSALLLIAFGVTGCSRKQAPTESKGQIGTASWYGKPFHGRLTASGETYDMEKLTAAHRTFPFGTKLRVQSLVTQKTVEIRVNDRGPFVGDRIIDLSHAAAQAIDMQGIANVRLEVLSVPPTRAADVFAVQIGAFTQRADAERVLADMQKRYGVARMIFRDGDQTWRILVGLEPTMESAQSLARQLEKEAGSAFVVRIDSDQ